MEWYTAFLLLMGAFFLLIIMGVPVVFSFFGVNVIFLGFFMGEAGFELLIDSVYGSLSVFVLLPITLFILMGEVLFRTGIAMKMINTLDTWLGAVPGRLSLLAVGSGTLLATLSGASIGTTAMLTRTLAPAMEERGYSKSLAIGPLLGSGGLAIMIPPSALGVILAVIASVSVGKLLVAIIIPGILLALTYIIYIVGACLINPAAGSAICGARVGFAERMVLTAKYVMPLSVVIFLVMGTIFLGVATPTEAAALGTAGAFPARRVLRPLTWKATSDALISTLQDLGHGARNPRGVAGLHAAARLYGGDTEAGGVGDRSPDFADLGDRSDASGDAGSRRPDRRHTADHDDDSDLHSCRHRAWL